MFFPETLLKGMKPAVFSHAFDRHNICAVGLDRKHRARLHRKSIGQDCARAANTGFATDMRPGQARYIADEVRQQKARLHVFFVDLAVNFDFHVHTAGLLLYAIRERGCIVC